MKDGASPLPSGRERYLTVMERTGIRREIRFKQWLNINEEIAYRKVKELYSDRIPETPIEMNEIKCEKAKRRKRHKESQMRTDTCRPGTDRLNNSL